MNYTLINKTKIPTKLLKNLINFSLPKRVKNVKIIFKYLKDGAFMGMSYGNKVIISINKYPKFPIYSVDKGLDKYGYGRPIVLYNRNETLLSLIAHELRHVWQTYVSKIDFEKGKRYVFTHYNNVYTSNYRAETDATNYSKKIIKKYRLLNK